MEILLKICDLKLNFSNYLGIAKVLENINLEIKRGIWFGLAGETGCGKSVTALSILKLLPSSAIISGGKILFQGEDILKKSEKEMRKLRGKEISMVFQDPQTSLNGAIKINRQLIETLFVHNKYNKREAKEICLDMLDRVRIRNPKRCFKQYPFELSGGMQQRVSIAMALLCNPKLLIADEFTTNLDVTVQLEIMNLVMELQKQFNMTILFITHDLSLINESCDYLTVMYTGQIIEIGKVKKVFTSPSHPYTKGLLKAVPSITGDKKKLRGINGFIPSLINPPLGCRFHTRCEYKMPGICDKEIPHQIELEKDHWVQCHLYK